MKAAPHPARKWLLSRKFLGTVLIYATGTYGLFTGLLTGGEWVAMATLVLGVFTAGEVAQKNLQ